MIKKLIELIKRRRIQILCIISGFVLYVLAMRFASHDGYLIGGDYLPRESYGKGVSRYELYVDGISEKETKVDIVIDARTYKADEIDDAFDKTMDILCSDMCADNPSLYEIDKAMQLPSKVEETGVKVEWYTDSPKLIDVSGEVHNEELSTPTDAILTARLSSSGYTSDYQIPITIVPPRLSTQDELVAKLLKSIAEADESQLTEGGIHLPTSLDDKTITYREDTTSNYNAIWALGIVAALLIYARERSSLKESIKYRDRQMLVDYPEIVSKLTVYIGAGMAIRPAWGAIVSDYEAHSHEVVRYAYEEMIRGWQQLTAGTAESKVYKEFGRACKLKQYMKLASILDQNRRSGLGNLVQLLSIESVEAWEERKNSAKRLGEEASTKLLVPMFIMLGIVMIMIMIPAFMSFY